MTLMTRKEAAARLGMSLLLSGPPPPNSPHLRPGLVGGPRQVLGDGLRTVGDQSEVEVSGTRMDIIFNWTAL